MEAYTDDQVREIAAAYKKKHKHADLYLTDEAARALLARDILHAVMMSPDEYTPKASEVRSLWERALKATNLY